MLPVGVHLLVETPARRMSCHAAVVTGRVLEGSSASPYPSDEVPWLGRESVV